MEKNEAFKYDLPRCWSKFILVFWEHSLWFRVCDKLLLLLSKSHYRDNYPMVKQKCCNRYEIQSDNWRRLVLSILMLLIRTKQFLIEICDRVSCNRIKFVFKVDLRTKTKWFFFCSILCFGCHFSVWTSNIKVKNLWLLFSLTMFNW